MPFRFINQLDLLGGEPFFSHLLDKTKSECRLTLFYATKTLIYQTVTRGLLKKTPRSLAWEEMFLHKVLSLNPSRARNHCARL